MLRETPAHEGVLSWCVKLLSLKGFSYVGCGRDDLCYYFTGCIGVVDFNGLSFIYPLRDHPMVFRAEVSNYRSAHGSAPTALHCCSYWPDIVAIVARLELPYFSANDGGEDVLTKFPEVKAI